VSGDFSTSKIKKQLFWEKAKTRKVFDKEVLMVPIWYENKHRMGRQAIRQLWIYKNEAKVYEAQVVELLATPQYMKTHAFINFKDFTGSVTIHHWHKGFLGGYQIESGERIGNIVDYSIGNKKKASSNHSRTTDCGYTTNETYWEPQCNCYGVIVNYVYVDCSFTYFYGSGGYDYYAWVDYNYSCESLGTCTPPTTYPEPEPQPEPTWLGKDSGYPDQWWLDDAWLDANFRTDPYDQFKKLTKAEKELVKQYPDLAYQISQNRAVAEQATIAKFGSNGLNDKSDAFRHAYFQAINTVSVDKIFAKDFSDAHESETPLAWSLEKQMDLFNNSVGIRYGDALNNFSPQDLINTIYSVLENGELRYLSPIDYSDSCFFGCSANPIGTHGITPSTSLIPSNR
jgi:hypothetical protein